MRFKHSPVLTADELYGDMLGFFIDSVAESKFCNLHFEVRSESRFSTYHKKLSLRATSFYSEYSCMSRDKAIRYTAQEIAAFYRKCSNWISVMLPRNKTHSLGFILRMDFEVEVAEEVETVVFNIPRGSIKDYSLPTKELFDSIPDGEPSKDIFKDSKVIPFKKG